MKAFIFGALLMAAIVAVAWKLQIDAQDRQMAEWRKTDPRLNATTKIQEELTNDVVGYSRTISIQVDDDKYFLTNWTADATVEFVNALGGVERTDIYYRCYATNVWLRDPEKTYLYFQNRVR